MQDTIFLDLETVRCQDLQVRQQIVAEAMASMKPSANCKSEASRLTSLKKKMDLFDSEEVISKTVFDGDYGEIITVGYAFEDDKVEALQRDGYMTETNILQEFFDKIVSYANSVNVPVKLFRPRWVAHNKAFDFRFLYKRCVILNINTHGIKIPVNDRHGSKYAFCTMEHWNGYGAKPGGSLDLICKLYGMAGKGDFCGADVNDAWENNEFGKIQEYCCEDVRMLREIYKRQNFIK